MFKNYLEITSKREREKMYKYGQKGLKDADKYLSKGDIINYDLLLPDNLFKIEQEYHLGVNQINKKDISTKKDFHNFLKKRIEINPSFLTGRSLLSNISKRVYKAKSDELIHQDLLIFSYLQERIPIDRRTMFYWADTDEYINNFFCIEVISNIAFPSESYDISFDDDKLNNIYNIYKNIFDKYNIKLELRENLNRYI